MEPVVNLNLTAVDWETLSGGEKPRDDEQAIEFTQPEDSYDSPDPIVSERVTNQAVATENGETEVQENLGVGFEEDSNPEPVEQASYNLADAGSRSDYQVQQDFKQQLDDLQEGDIAGFKKLIEDTNARILDDMKKGNITKEGGEKFTKEDFLNAAKMMEEAQRKVLDKMRQKAANAGLGNVDNSAADKAFLRQLERQARIDKWEALKDQQYVHYLKATLAGIKSSQKLAASAQG